MSVTKDIPALPDNPTPADIAKTLRPLRELAQIMAGFRGNAKALTMDDLIKKGWANAEGKLLVNAVPGPTGPPGPQGEPGTTETPDYTPPPTPTGLTVSAGIGTLIVQWDAPTYTQGHGHGQTNIYGAKWAHPDTDPPPTFSNAVRIDTAPGALTIASISTDPATTWCIWIKWQSKDGVESSSPEGGANGTQATTGVDVSALIKVLSDQNGFEPSSLPFIFQATPTTINGISVPAGTYINIAFIANGTISNAMIGHEVVDDSKISNLSAAKLTVGDGTIGGSLKSTNYSAGSTGWIVRPDGYAEFSNTVIRGTVLASAGAIGGSVIGSNYIKSATFDLGGQGWQFKSDGTGQIGGFIVGSTYIQSWTYGTNTQGWKFNNDGTGQIGGLVLGSNYLQSSNYSAGTTGMKISYNGDVEINNLTARGNITATNLNAATGTFSGALTADAVNAVNTINLQGEAVVITRIGSARLNSGTLAVTGSAQTMVSTPSADYANATIILTLFFDCTQGNPSVSTSTFRIRLYRNGMQIFSKVCSSTLYPDVQTNTIQISDVPNGTATYSATIEGITGTAVNIGPTSLTATGGKR